MEILSDEQMRDALAKFRPLQLPSASSAQAAVETREASQRVRSDAGSVTLTTAEIRHLAQFVGLIVAPTDEEIDADENEEEVTIMGCPEGGVFDEETEERHRYKHVAYFTEYPEEGVCPLGPKISQNIPHHQQIVQPRGRESLT